MISRIEEAIQKNLCSSSIVDKFPESLRSAIEYSVFPGGARIRPTILMSVAKACDDDIPDITDAAASALEMIHCASLPPLVRVSRGSPAVSTYELCIHKAELPHCVFLWGGFLLVMT